MSSKYFPLFFPDASSSSEVVVTREEFNTFHRIDRALFSRLVFVLNRDRNQSFEVFSFLLMLEQSGYARNIIAYLVSVPDAFFNSVADEVVVCLSFLYNQAFSTAFFDANTNDDFNSVIPLIGEMTGGKLTLRFIHHNRGVFLERLAKNMTDICRRAFDDIWVRAEMNNKEKPLALEREKAIEEMQKLSLTTTAQQGTTSRLSGRQETIIRPSLRPETATRPSVRPQTTTRPSVRPETALRPSVRRETIYRPIVRRETIALPLPPPRPPVQEEAKKTTAEKETKEEEKLALLAVEDRTVFLTFSKGYPISEEEVRVYFTRKLGDVIEEIVMQDVGVNVQPLFAKMVLKNRCALKLIEIVTTKNRNKFTINGKHIWARKYIPKNGPSASSSQI